MEKLKPCPFCGKAPVILNGGFKGWQVACTKYYSCKINPHTDYFQDKQDAIEVWNRRAENA